MVNKMQSSPIEYKPKKTLLTKELFEKTYLKKTGVPPIVNPLHLTTGLKLSNVKFNKLTIDNNSNIINSDYKSFLCDLELFNWQNIPEFKHNDIITRIKKPTIYRFYDIHLSKLLGNDLNLFLSTISESSTKFRYEKFLKKYKNSQEKFILIDIPYSNNYKLEDLDRLELESESDKLEYESDRRTIMKYINLPITIANVDDKVICYYSPQILNVNKRYAIINVILKSSNGGSHYTFMIIDHQQKIVDYYDPHGLSMHPNKIIVVLNTLNTLFKGYTITEFWKNTGLQTTENIEKDEDGFCVTWGHMMMHLKLLNMNVPIQDLENMFIEECKNKNLSLYEVMLNYAYTITRVLPSDKKKMEKLDY